MPTNAERLTRIIVEHLGTTPEAAANPDAHILDDLGADSLDVVEIVMAVEEEFGVELSNDEMESITTVASLLTLIDTLTRAVA